MAETIPNSDALTDDQIRKNLLTTNTLGQKGMKVDDSMSGVGGAMAREHPTIPKPKELPPTAEAPTLTPPPAAAPPEIPGAGATIPNLAKPTVQQSIATGMAQHGTTANAEGKLENQQMRPEVTAKPGTPEYGQQYQAQIDYDKAHPLGGAISDRPGTLGKLEHGLSRVANVAGDILAPGITQHIPGSDLNTQARENAAAHWINLGEENKEKEASTANTQAEAWVKMHPHDKPVGTPQITEGGELMQEMQGPDGTSRMVDLGERGKPSVAFETIADPNNPGQNVRVEVNRNAVPGAAGATTTLGGAKTGPEKAPKTIAMQDADGKTYTYQFDPNEKGEHGPWKKIGVAPPNTASLGLIGTLTPLLGPDGEIKGTFNTKTGKMNAIDADAVPAGATTGTGARLSSTQQNQFATGYIKPATDLEQQYQKAQAAVDAYNHDPKTGAAGMVLLASHLGTTLGSVKGATTGEHMVSEHQNAIGLADRAQRYLDYVATGQPLSADQVKDFNHLITETRNISWNVAAKEAARRQGEGKNVPVDFVPQDVKITMTTPGGKKIPVAGNQIQDALKDGLKIE